MSHDVPCARGDALLLTRGRTGSAEDLLLICSALAGERAALLRAARRRRRPARRLRALTGVARSLGSGPQAVLAALEQRVWRTERAA